MINEQFQRTALIIGDDAVKKLNESHVIVFGLGGVGAYAVESLIRSGLGEITLVDNDIISKTNLNRQLLALHSTLGKSKVEVARERIIDINPLVKVHTINHFFLPENQAEFDFSKYDYVVDCIDTVSAKIALIEKSKKEKCPVITCLGTGNKLNPMGFKISFIEKTNTCPLAKVLRKELKNRGITKIKCVYSEEIPVSAIADSSNGRHSPGSISFVPPAAGLLIASEVISDLIKQEQSN